MMRPSDQLHLRGGPEPHHCDHLVEVFREASVRSWTPFSVLMNAAGRSPEDHRQKIGRRQPGKERTGLRVGLMVRFRAAPENR